MVIGHGTILVLTKCEIIRRHNGYVTVIWVQSYNGISNRTPGVGLITLSTEVIIMTHVI